MDGNATKHDSVHAVSIRSWSIVRVCQNGKPSDWATTFNSHPLFKHCSASQFRQFLSGRHKLQCQPVIAISLSGRFRPIVEDVTLMTAAPHAVVFGTRSNQLVVGPSSDRACQKLGQPVPLSNLVALSNSGRKHAAQMKVPFRFSSFRGLLPGRSVASSNMTA
jgi:hypothetical protein